MARFSIVLALTAALVACTAQSEEDQLETVIRDNLSSQGNVQDVEMERQEDGSMAGHVMIEEKNGRVGRLACNARPGEAKGEYDWNCSPAIDEKSENEMEAIIREELSKRGPVLELEMKRAGDDNHMTGFARVEDETGEEFRLACSATRNSEEAGAFTWECGDAPETAEEA